MKTVDVSGCNAKYWCVCAPIDFYNQICVTEHVLFIPLTNKNFIDPQLMHLFNWLLVHQLIYMINVSTFLMIHTCYNPHGVSKWSCKI